MATEDTEKPTIDDRPVGETSARARLTGDRYKLGERIGLGGMGEIMAARDEHLGREVAIKLMRAVDPNALQIARFEREARVQGRLDHPAIVPVHDLGRDLAGRPFFAMKKLTGTTLAKILRSPIIDQQGLLRAFVDVCLAVEFAHVHGVIHRDLKPDNILLGEFGEVYVLDWGLAKVAGEVGELDDLRADGLTTLQGTVVGTVSYMSPEQGHDSADVDARTDVFALGRLLGEIIGHGEAPPELAALSARATIEDREQRLVTARELAGAVTSFLDGDRDLALRDELARGHLERARAAFARGDDVQRQVAMREAAAAMALAPKLTAAAELVSRLMLEPPRTLPHEVERAIASDDLAFARAQGWARMTLSVVGFFLVVPYLLYTGAYTGAGVLGAGIAASSITSFFSLRRPRRDPPPVWAFIAINIVVLVLLSMMFSPIIVAPAVGGLSLVSLAATRDLARIRSVLAVALAYFAALVLPAVAERYGVLPSTLDVQPNGVLLHPPSHLEDAMMTAIVMFAIGIITAAIMLGRLTRAQERSSHRQLHLQAWQLRQLVADPLAEPR